MVHEINFLVAAGSDFQGTNKPDIPLGMDVSTETSVRKTSNREVKE